MRVQGFVKRSENRERDEHQPKRAARDYDLGRHVHLAISIQANDLSFIRLLVPEETFDRTGNIVAGEADVPEFPVVQGLKLVHRLASLPSPEPTDDHPRESGSRARIVMIRHVSLRKTAGRRAAVGGVPGSWKSGARKLRHRADAKQAACVESGYPGDRRIAGPRGHWRISNAPDRKRDGRLMRRPARRRGHS